MTHHHITRIRTMAHIVIVGAGIGGVPGAFELREALGDKHRITVVNATDYFQFVPSNPWLAVGWRTRDKITVPIGPCLKKRGIEFVVVSGDMIEGTVTATLLERANPGAIEQRREVAGKLLNVEEFAAEVARAAVDPVPEDHTRLTGDTSSFTGQR